MNQIAAIKAPLPVAEHAPARQPAISASATGVKTGDIAPENTVPPPQRTENVRPRASRPQPDPALAAAKPSAPVAAEDDSARSPEPVTRATVKNIEFNAEVRDVIFQSLSEDTGEVVAQVPSEALLKIRQYVRGKQPDGPTGLVRRIA